MGLTPMIIKVISEEFIKPSCPTPNHLRNLQASLFDHVNTPVLMPLIFFFYSQKHATKIGTREILGRLQGSLPSTLSVFYPLAGRVQDVNHIDCNDEGVPYVLAEVDKPLKDVVHTAEVSQLDKLLPSYGQEGYTTLLLAIQVNVFACGGVSIGVKMSHAVSDAFSFLMFVKTWASIASGNNQHTNLGYPYFEVCKSFPPSPQKNNNNMDDNCANQNPDLIKDRPVTKWFMFSEDKLNFLRSKLISDTNLAIKNDDCVCNNNKTSLPSLSMVLSAFIWSRIKVACHNSVNYIPHKVYQAVNVRPRVSPPDEHSYYFGNMVVNAIAKRSSHPSMVLNDASNSSNESLWWSDILREMKESVRKIIGDDGFIRKMQEGKEDLSFMMEHFERESKGEIVVLGFSNLRSLPLYEADFGWGKPVWVTSATLIYKNLIILIPAGPLSKDIVAYINLSCEDMAKLESDTEFTALVPKVSCVSSKL